MPMTETATTAILDWIVARGLAGDDEVALLHGFCDRCVDAGLALERGTAIIDTLHPLYEGRVFNWRRDGQLERAVVEYQSSHEGEAAEAWRKSPFHHLLESGRSEIRFRLARGETADFPVLEELRADGQTDYFGMVQRFDKDKAIGEIDCFLSRWTTARPSGFDDSEIAALR